MKIHIHNIYMGTSTVLLTFENYFFYVLNICILILFRIQIHRAVFEKLRFEKKHKKILTLNISEIYGPIILPKELDRELSKIYIDKEF